MRTIAILLALLSPMAGRSQALYPEIPAVAWECILDRVEDLSGYQIGGRMGHYVGQVDKNKKLAGFGYYIDAKDNQRIGLFRAGLFVYGITLTADCALVGSTDDYVCYSLTTSQIDYANLNGERTKPQTQSQFVSINYPNGDRYIGEYRNGRRHGLGLYYYTNGDFWFGQYVEGVRKGYGCLFGHDNLLFAGRWDNEDYQRQIFIRTENQ